MPSEVNGNSSVGLDPFDPARYRLSQQVVEVKRHLTSIPVRKPDRSWFVQCRLGDEFRLLTHVLELSDDREIHLIDPELMELIEGEPCVSLRYLVTAITRQGTLFLWPVKQPDASGKLDTWNRSALEAIELASCGWIRVCANVERGAYDTISAQVALAPPKWPDIEFKEILRIAFRNHYVDKYDHPVLRKLRGEF